MSNTDQQKGSQPLSDPKKEDNKSKTEEDFNDYYDSLTILHCCGDKCRIHAHDGQGFHCESCYGDADEIERIPITIKLMDPNNPEIVNCHGHKCRLDGSEGIFCESCYGDYDDYHNWRRILLN